MKNLYDLHVGNRRQPPLLYLISILLIAFVAGCNGTAIEAPVATDSAEASATDVPNAEATAPVEEAAATDGPVSATAVPRPDVVAEGGASGMQPLERNGMYDAPPEMTIDPSKYYYATFKTAKGDIKAQLYADRAPLTVNSFVFLAREGFYNDTTFHRVLEEFMAQAGDPTGTGSGGPGYQFADEFDPNLAFDAAGLLAMANAGAGTNGSQFFITLAPTEWLNNRHTIFGKVIEGMDVLNSLTMRDPNTAPDFEGDTLYTVIIDESEESTLPPPPPTPTPFAPSSLESENRPLATVDPSERSGYFNSPPDVIIDSAKSYTATITTSKGDIVVMLHDDEAPIAVNNFVLLANLGFYDNTPVNQISPGQLVIIGSPDNNPNGDAGYLLSPEVNIPVEMAIGLVGYVPLQGTTPTSSSSQLILALVAPPVEANADFSFFGQITSGVDILVQLTGEDIITSIVITESAE